MNHNLHQEAIYRADDIIENFNIQDKPVKNLSRHEMRCLTLGQACICNNGVLAIKDVVKG